MAKKNRGILGNLVTGTNDTLETVGRLAGFGAQVITDSAGNAIDVAGQATSKALFGDMVPNKSIVQQFMRPASSHTQPGLPPDLTSAQAARLAEMNKMAAELANGRANEGVNNFNAYGGVGKGMYGPPTPAGYMENLVSPPVFGPPVKSTTGGSDYGAAYGGSPEGLEGFYAPQYQGVLNAQQEVIEVRAAQNTNIADLEASRAKEGLDQAVADLEAARAERVKIEAAIMSVEQDVGREFQGGGTAAQHRAEVNNRITQLKPVYDEVLLRESSAIANINTRNALVEQRFNAVRADATEAVNRSLQKLGFKTANIDMAFGMMNNMKQYEMNSDAFVTKKEQEARADFSVYAAVPGYLKDMKPEVRRKLEKDAGFIPGFIDSVAENPQAAFSGVDVNSGYYYSVYQKPGSQDIEFKSSRIFTPPSSYSSATREAELGLDKTSEAFQATWREEVQYVAATAAQSKDDPSAYLQAKYVSIGELSKVADLKNEAEKHQIEKFKSIFPDSGMTPENLAAIGTLINQ